MYQLAYDLWLPLKLTTTNTQPKTFIFIYKIVPIPSPVGGPFNTQVSAKYVTLHAIIDFHETHTAVIFKM